VTLVTAGDLVSFALRASSVNGVGQTPMAEDSNDGLVMLNTLLAEWQYNRWLVFDLVEATAAGSGAAGYTVGAAGAFVLSFAGERPDRIDAAFARLVASSTDTPLYPFQSREGYDRVASKTATGAPEAYFYDATSGSTGTIYFSPAPTASYSMRIKAKASLGQFADLTSPLNVLPRQYTAALIWNLAEVLRPLYGMPPDPTISAKAQASLLAIGGSQAQMIQAQQPTPSRRSGTFAHIAPPQQPQQARQQ